MTHAREPLPGPPRWPLAVLRSVLTCDPMRDAIFGDLHEEFVRDAERLGLPRARARYRRRAASIVTHAVWDSLCWRGWMSSDPISDRAQHAADRTALPQSGDVARALRETSVMARSVGGDLGLAVLALGVLLAGIVINTIVFSAVEATQPPASEGSLLLSAFGVGSFVILLASAGVSAVILCAGPRWRRRRHQETVNIR